MEFDDNLYLTKTKWAHTCDVWRTVPGTKSVFKRCWLSSVPWFFVLSLSFVKMPWFWTQWLSWLPVPSSFSKCHPFSKLTVYQGLYHLLMPWKASVGLPVGELLLGFYLQSLFIACIFAPGYSHMPGCKPSPSRYYLLQQFSASVFSYIKVLYSNISQSMLSLLKGKRDVLMIRNVWVIAFYLYLSSDKTQTTLAFLKIWASWKKTTCQCVWHCNSWTYFYHIMPPLHFLNQHLSSSCNHCLMGTLSE